MRNFCVGAIGYRCGECGGDEGPVLFVLRSRFDPFLENRDLRWGEVLFGFPGWHAFVWVLGVEAFDHFAQGGFSGDDGRLTGFAALECPGHFAQQKFTFSALFIGPVA